MISNFLSLLENLSRVKGNYAYFAMLNYFYYNTNLVRNGSQYFQDFNCNMHQ